MLAQVLPSLPPMGASVSSSNPGPEVHYEESACKYAGQDVLDLTVGTEPLEAHVELSGDPNFIDLTLSDD
jgi:hypothetical protein